MFKAIIIHFFCDINSRSHIRGWNNRIVIVVYCLYVHLVLLCVGTLLWLEVGAPERAISCNNQPSPMTNKAAHSQCSVYIALKFKNISFFVWLLFAALWQIKGPTVYSILVQMNCNATLGIFWIKTTFLCCLWPDSASYFPFICIYMMQIRHCHWLSLHCRLEDSCWNVRKLALSLIGHRKNHHHTHY